MLDQYITHTRPALVPNPPVACERCQGTVVNLNTQEYGCVQCGWRWYSRVPRFELASRLLGQKVVSIEEIRLVLQEMRSGLPARSRVEVPMETVYLLHHEWGWSIDKIHQVTGQPLALITEICAEAEA